MIEKFSIEVDVFVSKKKKLVHLSFLKPFISYPFLEELIDFVKSYWQKRKYFYPGYYFIYPKRNQRLKWKFDYVFIVKNKPSNKKMDDLLDRFFEKLESSFKKEFYQYTVKISQIKGSFYMLIRKPRGKILGDDLNILFEKVGNISKYVCKNFARDTCLFRYSFFPYFELVRCYGSYHYHFLVIRKDYKY